MLKVNKGIYAEETELIKAHQQTFDIGLFCALEAITKGTDTIAPIPEEMFAEVLE